MNKEYDVIIIGAGPAGLSFARSLADLPLSIAVIERSSISTLENPPEDGREIALTHQSVELMKTFDIWRHIPDHDISPIEAAKVFDGNSSYSLNFDNKSQSLDALGYLIPNHQIRKAYFKETSQHPEIEFITETTVEDVSTCDEYGQVTLNNGCRLHAHLIIAADTRFSEMRRKMGLSASMKDFSRSAIVCRMEHEKPHNQTAFECFHYGRTTAILPMNGNRSSIVVTVNSRDAAHYAHMSETEFNSNIEQQMDGLLGEMKLLGKRHVYPLVAVHANQFVSQRFALIGDAAVGMHPVTAHGFNLGLKGQASLANKIKLAIAEGKDIADEELLRTHEAELIRTTRVMYHGTNLVVGLFTNESFAAKLARKATLRLANNISPLKQLITDSLTEKDEHPLTPLEEIQRHLPPLPHNQSVTELRRKVKSIIPEKLKPSKIFGVY